MIPPLIKIEKEIQVELNPSKENRAKRWLVQKWEHKARDCFVHFLYDNADYEIPENCMVIMHYCKPDGKEIIRPLLVHENAAVITFDDQMTAVPGLAAAQILICDWKDEIKVRSPMLYFQIAEGLGQSRIRSASEYSILNQMLDKIRNTFQEIPNLIELAKRMEEAAEKTEEITKKAEKAVGTIEETKQTTEEYLKKIDEKVARGEQIVESLSSHLHNISFIELEEDSDGNEENTASAHE